MSRPEISNQTLISILTFYLGILLMQTFIFIFCRMAVTIMKKFCRDSPVERLGYQKDGVMDIKKNRWFQVKI